MNRRSFRSVLLFLVIEKKVLWTEGSCSTTLNIRIDRKRCLLTISIVAYAALLRTMHGYFAEMLAVTSPWPHALSVFGLAVLLLVLIEVIRPPRGG